MAKQNWIRVCVAWILRELWSRFKPGVFSLILIGVAAVITAIIAYFSELPPVMWIPVICLAVCVVAVMVAIVSKAVLAFQDWKSQKEHTIPFKRRNFMMKL